VPSLQGHGTCHEGLPESLCIHCSNDGGYVSASHVEDDLALAANHVADSESEEECGRTA
jgi:hypothetical protein